MASEIITKEKIDFRIIYYMIKELTNFRKNRMVNMPRSDITMAIIKQIADHHDQNPSDFKEFKTAGRLVLATKQGGSMQDSRARELRLNHRISDAFDTLTCHHAITEALLPLKGGKQFIIIYIK